MALAKATAKRVLKTFGYTVSRAPSLGDFLRSRQVSLVLDVGANVGQYCDQLRNSEGYKGQIISFEPIKAVYDELSSRMSADRLWRGKNLALGGEKGIADINVSDGSVFSSIRPQSRYARQFDSHATVVRTERINVRPLTDFTEELHSHRNIFCKIDTQGFEEEVLKGASGITDMLCGIQIELPLMHLYEQTWSFSEAVGRLAQLGFVPAQFHQTNPITEDPSSWVEADCIFRRA